MTCYEILGLKEGSSIETVTSQYNILTRKLKETDLSGSPLEKDRNLRLQQLRAAYEEIIYKIPMPEHLVDPFTHEVQLVEVGQFTFTAVEKLIDQNRFEEAIQQLQSFHNNDKNAYWKYLFGLALWGKGLTNDALTFLQQAAAMEPNTQMYVDTYNELLTNINAAIQSEQNKRNAEIAAGTALIGTGLCASCLCDSCCNS